MRLYDDDDDDDDDNDDVASPRIGIAQTMDKFRGKYRIPSARWAAWDYGSNAAYFVTICTAQRIHYFGHVANGAMALSALGHAAQDCWVRIPDHFPFVRLGASVVMPNHVHGIIIIDKPVQDGVTAAVETQMAVETQNFASLQQQRQRQQPKNRFGPQSQNLASIVRGYKIGVTKSARQNDLPFGWQARFHDHVIRNAEEYTRIEHYIQTNPQNWRSDSLFVE